MLSSDKFGHPLAGVARDPARRPRRGHRSASCSPCPRAGSSGDYLAIVTLFFGQIFYVLVNQGYRVSFLGLNKDLGLEHNWDLTGGPNGIAQRRPLPALRPHGSSEHAYYYVTLAAVVVVFAALSLANRSRTGRAWRALHDDSLAAQAMSMPVNRLKLMAVGVGAARRGLAGTINAALLQGAFPDDYNTQVLIIIYAMVILGGRGKPCRARRRRCRRRGAPARRLRPQTPISDWTSTALGLLRARSSLILFAKIRPWRRLAAILGGLVVFGVVVHMIVAVQSTAGTAGPLNTGVGGHSADGGWLRMALRHWLVLPADTYETGTQVAVQHRIRRADRPRARPDARSTVGSATCCSCRRSGSPASSGRRASSHEASGPTRPLLLGVVLIVAHGRAAARAVREATGGDRLMADASARAARRQQGVRRAPGASAISTSRCERARSSASSGRTARARRRSSTSSPGSTGRTRATSCSTARASSGSLRTRSRTAASRARSRRSGCS